MQTPHLNVLWMDTRNGRENSMRYWCSSHGYVDIFLYTEGWSDTHVIHEAGKHDATYDELDHCVLVPFQKLHKARSTWAGHKACE